MPLIERRALFAASAAAIGAAVPAEAAEAIVLTEYWATKQRNGAEIRLAMYRKRIGNAARPVLFLVHGSSTSARSSFDLSVPGHDDYSMMDAFARYGFDVWTMDHEGYGKSSRTDSNSDIASGVEDLKAATAVIARETGQTRCRNSSPICRTCADSGPCMGLLVSSSFWWPDSNVHSGRRLDGTCTSISSIAARRLDLGESIQVEIDDRLKRNPGSTVAEALGQRIEPCGTFRLDREHFSEGVVPALGPTPPIHRLVVFNHNPGLECLQSGAMASLALSVAEGVFTLRFTASEHGSVLRY